jgi:hypothetical protein
MTDMSLNEWSRTMRPEDMTVEGLARLEAELFRPYPEVQGAIRDAVGQFEPAARDSESRHGGRALMAPVQARRNQDWRVSPNFGLALLSFLIILLPACALGISVRGRWDYEGVILTTAVLLALTAIICIVKVLSTLRDPVWAGIMPRWAVGAASVSLGTTLWSIYQHSQLGSDDSAGAITVMVCSTVAVVAFAALSLSRNASSARALTADLAELQPRMNAYLGEINSQYTMALARIQDAVSTLDPNLRVKLLNQRNAVVSNLAANRGLYQGNVPLLMNKKELGEFGLFAVAEPLLGGGPYPVHGRPAKSFTLPPSA